MMFCSHSQKFTTRKVYVCRCPPTVIETQCTPKLSRGPQLLTLPGADAARHGGLSVRHNADVIGDTVSRDVSGSMATGMNIEQSSPGSVSPSNDDAPETPWKQPNNISPSVSGIFMTVQPSTRSEP